MKKTLSMLALAAMMLSVSSCSKDNVEEPENGKVTTVQLAVELPEGISARAPKANGPKRAYADGTTATTLQYAVYEQGKTAPLAIIDGSKTLGEKTINLNTTVQLQLVTGKTYDIVFWAANEGAPYSFDPATQKVTVDYNGMKANDESLDAFFRCYTYTAGTEVENPIKLYRPFAQLNVGTADKAAAKAGGFAVDAAQTQVKVTGIYNTLNLATGAVEGADERTYAFNAIPSGEKFPKEGYEYLSMDYLLVAKDKANVDVEWSIDDKGGNKIDRSFANVPVQRNYRTNIFGNLLTSTTDFNVEIVPAFETPDYEYTVSSEAELNTAIANAPAGSNILLANDLTVSSTLDLSNKEVTIDLNGKKLTIDKTATSSGNRLINVEGKSEIKNGTIYNQQTGNIAAITVQNGGELTVDNVNLTSDSYSGFYVQAQNGTTAKLTLKNSTVKALYYGVGTNADTKFSPNKPTIEIENSNLTAETAVMLNVEGTLTINKSDLTGYWQALIVRGGTATVKDSKLTLSFYEDQSADSNKNYKMGGDWDGGNQMPISAIVLGTNGTGAYQYPTIFTMTGSTVVGADPFRAVIMHEAGKNTVAYNVDNSNTITGKVLKWNGTVYAEQ